MSLIIAKKTPKSCSRITLRFIITILFPSFNNASKGKGLKQKLFEKN